MKKQIPNIPESREIKTIIGTRYVLLPDGRVAGLLKPMSINNVIHYNLIVDGNPDYIRANPEKLIEMTNKHYSECDWAKPKNKK